MKSFNDWFAEQKPIEPEDDTAYLLECHCGKSAWHSRAEIESGDAGWYVEFGDDGWPIHSLCCSSQYCIP